MSSPPKKNYRRFRAHGERDGDPEAGLAALRSLNAEPAAKPRAAAPDRKPPPVRRPVTGKRRWWSLRGVGGAGIALRFGGVLLVAIAIWAVAGFLALRGAAGEANSRISKGARAALADPHGGLLGTPENTLVLGSDARRGSSGARADTILIMRTDPDSGRLKYLSIPRDTRVELPGVGNVKLGETYAHRGIRGVVGTIRREFGVPINHVIVVDFTGVAEMVDAVGGIDVDNPFDIVDCAYSGGTTVTFRKGPLHLDGARALQYSRVRKCDSDIMRAQRQQLVVAGLKQRVLSWSSLPVAPFRGADIVRTLSTDMSATDLAKFGWLQGRLTTGPGDRDVLATEGATIGGISYQLYDPNRAAPQLRRFMGT